MCVCVCVCVCFGAEKSSCVCVRACVGRYVRPSLFQRLELVTLTHKGRCPIDFLCLSDVDICGGGCQIATVAGGGKEVPKTNEDK